MECKCEIGVCLVEHWTRNVAHEVAELGECIAVPGSFRIRLRCHKFGEVFDTGRPGAVDLDAPAARLADPSQQLGDDARLSRLPWRTQNDRAALDVDAL